MYYVLYIAINISTITVDKYSGLFTTRGTKRSCGTLLPLGCHRAPGGRHWVGRHLFGSYDFKMKTSRSKTAGSFDHSSSTVSFLGTSSFWSRTWGVGLGRAVTSVAAREEGSCWSTILREDGSSCGNTGVYDYWFCICCLAQCFIATHPFTFWLQKGCLVTFFSKTLN